jgi:hypothetical protein
MNDIRSAIINGTFAKFREEFLAGYKTTNEQTRVDQKGKWLRGRKGGDTT